MRDTDTATNEMPMLMTFGYRARHRARCHNDGAYGTDTATAPDIAELPHARSAKRIFLDYLCEPS